MTNTQFVTRKDSTPHNGASSAAVLPLPDEKPGIAGLYLAAPAADTAALPLSVRKHLHV